MVLKYHPDKRKKDEQLDIPKELKLHDYFTCITKAFEQLSNIESRQSYDSVDPSVDDTTPTSYNVKKQDFYRVFKPVFERNARWSNKQPVPLLGDKELNIDKVNEFYTFWFEFSSWRVFTYENLEDIENAESREERRWIERENRGKMNKVRKEEMARIKNFVELAYQNDPRIKKHREDEKRKKLEIKKAKEDAAAEEKKKQQEALEEERKQKEKEEQEAKEKAQKEKKEKDKIKKAAARDRKAIRQFVKGENHFGLDKDDLSSLERLEKSMENLTLESLQMLKGLADKNDKESFKKTYSQMSNEILEKLNMDSEKRKQEELAKTQTSSKQPPSAAQSNSSDNNKWSELELQLLVKATTLFPIGTATRWEVIADYINEHGQNEGNRKNGKQVIFKVKNLKKSDTKLKEEVNQKAFSALEKTTSAKQGSQSSQNITSNVTVKDTGGDDSNPWSSDEQRLLEQALKLYDGKTKERWEKISLAVPSRTKKECMKRYKELVEMIKAKKAAATQ